MPPNLPSKKITFPGKGCGEEWETSVRDWLGSRFNDRDDEMVPSTRK